ncbi:hypothetical protein Tco_1004192 [Tanacetum coccineum]|uniref:Uncharacterized protein n=1 Tax=Tanacetum coccineum TaxID=301880 RepID=A0ABQ5FBT9_9ASTR
MTKNSVEQWTMRRDSFVYAFVAKSEDSVQGNAKSAGFGEEGSSSEYLRIKEGELELEDRKRHEQGELVEI